MHGTVEGGNLAPVTHKERGQEITRRRLAHGITSVRDFTERTGLAREAVAKAEKGTASEGTYQRLEAWLDAFDEETGDNTRQDASPPASSGHVVTFEAEGLFGVARVAVQGPVEDADELQERFERLLTNLLRQQGAPPSDVT